jgi:hypothetical protein
VTSLLLVCIHSRFVFAIHTVDRWKEFLGEFLVRSKSHIGEYSVADVKRFDYLIIVYLLLGFHSVEFWCSLIRVRTMQLHRLFLSVECHRYSISRMTGFVLFADLVDARGIYAGFALRTFR